MAGRADALKSGAVVVGGEREGVTLAGDRTKTSASFVSETLSAGVPGGAAAGNGDARALGRTPREASCAQALAGLAVVVGNAFRWHVVAGVGCRAPGGSGAEGQASAAVVVGRTTRGDCDTLLAESAPALSGRADAQRSQAVVAGRCRAVGRNVVARVG